MVVHFVSTSKQKNQKEKKKKEKKEGFFYTNYLRPVFLARMVVLSALELSIQRIHQKFEKVLQAL